MVVYTLEQRWEILRHYFLQFWQKKSSFQMKLILIFAVTNSHNQIVEFGAQKTRTHTLKSQRTQSESLFGADFGPEA